MAMRLSESTLGIDVSKAELVICDWQSGQFARIDNQQAAISAWLDTLHGPVRIALEATSDYHLEVVAQAHARAIPVYLLNPRQLAHYRQAIDLRNKTDPQDAWLLARYLAHEAHALRPFRPACAKARRLWSLLKRRALLVNTKKQIDQSFSDIGLSYKALCTEIRKLLYRIDRCMHKLLRELAWDDDYQRCRSIPGIGPLNAIALVCVYHRGTFASADAFIAFIGLDIRVRQSGRFQGKPRLSKRGEAEVRRLLWCAAQPARNHQPFDDYYQSQLDKGLSKIEAKLILARKLARIAYALLSKKQPFEQTSNSGIHP